MPKWLRYLLIAVAALAALATRVNWTRERRVAANVPKDLARIEIAKAGKKAVLAKEDGRWRLKEPVDYPADAESVEGLVKALGSLEVGDRLSGRAEGQQRYEVNDSSGIAVRAAGPGGKDAVSVVFGKMAPDLSHIYLRLPPAPDVYLGSGFPRFAIEKEPDQWRSRRLLGLNPGEDIATINVVKGKTSLVVAKSSNTYTVNGAPGEVMKAGGYFSQAHVAEADGFIDGPDAEKLSAYGLDKPAEKIFVVTTARRGIELHVGAQDKAANRFPVRRVGEVSLFWAPSYVIEAFSPDPKTLVATSPKK